MINPKKIFCCSSFLLGVLFSNAQKTGPANTIITGTWPTDSTLRVCIKDIRVKGAKKTKTYIILREMQFKKGDSLSITQLNEELKQARQQVYNTTLFTETIMEADISNGKDISITVTVKEKWYVYPVPQFQLVDRNFNVWAKTYKYSLDRVNYGLKFAHYNLSGRRDQLRIYLLNGYARNISFSYNAPYSNSALTEGFVIGGGFTQNREIAYKTSADNNVQFYPVDSATKARSEFVRNSWYASAGYIIRKGLFKKHVFSAGYAHLKVADSVVNAKFNPNYFKDSTNTKSYVDLQYTYQYVNVDNVMYPLKGTIDFVSVAKRGLGFSGGVNMLSIEAGLNKYYALGRNWYTSLQFYGRIKLPFDQAYINQRGLGYGEIYLRGQEYYVVDGVATALLRTTLRKKLFSFDVPLPILHKLATKIPVTVFAKTFADLGYEYNKKKYYSYLNNRLLYTGGFGIDVLTLYDISFRFEYSFNQLNRNGLFFHTQNGF